MLTYNNKIKHSATGFTPSDAKKKAIETDVRLNLLNKKKHDRRYPLLSIGDKVKIYKEKEPGEKERTSNWSNNTYQVESISKTHGHTYFKVEGVIREYSRRELLKV